MEYDSLNRMTSAYTRTKNGELYAISYTYDELGNVVEVIDAEGNVTQTNKYDAMGRLERSTDALGVDTEYDYDEMGNLLESVTWLNAESRTTSFGYDKLGRMNSVTDAMGGITKVTYDRQGNVETLTDANGGVTEYAYDSMGQMVESVSPLGNRYSYTYNAAGLLEESLNARGQATTYTYDKVGRVTSVTDELGTVHYTYDPNGNVLTVTDDQGTISRKYDALNRVTEYTDYKGNTVQYSYDEIGNLIALTYPGGEIVRYTYYKNGWLHTVTDAKGKVTKYTYDARGNLIHTERPNGTEEICTFNEAGLLVSQKDVRGEEVLTEFTYSYDDNGNVTTIEGTETTVTEEGISRLSSAEMVYDKENRLIRYNGKDVRYDADGNMTYGPVNGVMSELVYDCRNRLVEAGDICYKYDAENNRIAMETYEYLEEYVVDTVSSGLSRVLTSTRTECESGEVSEPTIRIFGKGLICEYTGDSYQYHHYNNLGSTMKLTNRWGEVIASYTYGVYGELLSGDNSLTSYLYNGRCGVTTDSNGLYYMRQRYYNPEIKRFVNQDILTGSMSNSQSLNRYSYVQGNPVSYTDPFGLSPSNGMYTGDTPDTTLLHGILALVGLFPTPIGLFANIWDLVVYAFVDHDEGMTALAAVSLVTFGVGNIGKLAATSAKFGKMAKVGRALDVGCSFLFNGVEFLQNGTNALKSGQAMWQKYFVNGEPMGWHTVEEYFVYKYYVAATALAAVGFGDDSAKLVEKLDIEIPPMNNGGYLNLDAFKRKSGSSSIVEIVDKEKGTFIIKDWSNYPDDYVPVPDKNKVWTFLEGDEYNSARDSANTFNRNMRSADPYYANNGLEIHEIEPVKMGGSPTDINNKTAIQSQVHRRYVTPWWNKIRDEVKKGLN